jgi:hypothetical protein
MPVPTASFREFVGPLKLLGPGLVVAYFNHSPWRRDMARLLKVHTRRGRGFGRNRQSF